MGVTVRRVILALFAVWGVSASAAPPGPLPRPVEASPAASDRIVLKLVPGSPVGVGHVRELLEGLGIPTDGIGPVFEAAHQARLRGLTESEVLADTRERLALRSPARALPEPAAPRGLGDVYLVRLAEGTAESAFLSLDSALDILRTDPRVLWAEPDVEVSELLVPDDPYYSSSGTWGQSYDDLWGLKTLQCEGAWDVTTGSPSVVVAVVDSGMDYNHEDLRMKPWINPGEIPENGVDDDGNGYIDDLIGWDFCTFDGNVRDNDPFDERGHGTHVAGTLAAATDNGQGVAGVSWASRLMTLRGLDVSGRGWTTDLSAAIVYAADNGASIINNSWGGWGWTAPQVLQDAVGHAYDLGCLVVAAAGNSNADALTSYPGNLKETLTVSAFTPTDTRASFSNWGVKIDVAAPGEDILAPLAAGSWFEQNLTGKIVDGTYFRADGTSMAAPHVSGLAALILAAHPGFTHEQVRQVLRASAHDTGTPGWDTDSGYGRIDATEALGIDSALTALITAPEHRSLLKGTVEIVGTAAGPGFVRYRVEYGTGLTPTAWTLISNSSTEVIDGVLASWDTSGLDDGEYTLRLAADDANGRSFQDRAVVWRDEAIRPGWPVELYGPAYSNPAVCAVDASPGMEVVLGHPLGSGNEAEGRYRVHAHDGLSLPGLWPRTTIDPTANSAAVGDVDLDGSVEIVGSSMGYRMLYAWRSDGTPLSPAFPVDVSRNTYNFQWGGYVADLSPVLADVDADPEREMLFQAVGVVHAINADGSEAPGWPVTLMTLANLKRIIDSRAVAVGDLDDDGLPEIVALTSYEDSSFPYTRHTWVHVLNHDGTAIGTGSWPVYETTINASSSGPTLGDIDNDGDLEVLVGGMSVVHAWHHDGTPVTGWPAAVSNWVMTDPVLADLDGDGRLEVLVTTTGHLLHALKDNGTSHFVRSVTVGGNPHPVVGDVDGDGQPEVLVGGFYGELHAFNHDGSPATGWPRRTRDLISTGAALGDLDDDRLLDVIVGSKDHRLYAWELSEPYDPFGMRWPVYRGSTHHTGRHLPPERPCTVPPAEVEGVEVTESAHTRLSWNATEPGLRYDVAGGRVGDLRVDGGVSGASCLADDWVEGAWGDLRADPTPGGAEYYLVRGVSLCGAGSYGSGSDEAQRSPGDDCP